MADGTFHQPLIVHAVDSDEPHTANSQVAYEIIAGNQNEQFSIDTVSGAIYPSINGLSGFDDLTSSNPANVPQIPPILNEPITPYNPHSSQQSGSNTFGQHHDHNQVTPDLTGRIKPSHEIEETTMRPARPRDNSNIQYNQLQQQNWTSMDTSSSSSQPRKIHKITVQVNDSPALKSFESAHSNRADGNNQSSSVDSKNEIEPKRSGRLNSEQNQRLNSRLRAVSMDQDQLPALDLLLNLESTNEHSQVEKNPKSDPSSTAQQSKVHQTRSVGGLKQAQFGSAGILKMPPVTTLIVRAHDFGIPLRSSTVKINIYNQALLSRSVSVILNGTAEQLELRRDAIERAFSSITGSKATIETIEALSESSSISVARVKLAVPQHSLVDLTDLSALMNAIDYHPHQFENQQSRHPTTITHYIPSDRLIPTTNTMSSNITSGVGGFFNDIHSYAIDTSGLERRLLIYIIIVGVCILALLVIWMIYSCSREDRVK